jgi:hypothetical protein
MPVLLVNNDGTGEASFKTDRFTLKDLFDEDGSAIMVHALPDNYANIPERYGEVDQETLATGDSGERIACGAIQKRWATGEVGDAWGTRGSIDHSLEALIEEHLMDLGAYFRRSRETGLSQKGSFLRFGFSS